VTASPAFDHIALTVPNLNEQVERFINDLGLDVHRRMDGFAVLVDPASGIRFELSASDDDAIHVRHLGFRAGDVDAAHAELVAAGMQTGQEPHRQDFAQMYTSYLQQPGCVEVQLVKYDD